MADEEWIKKLEDGRKVKFIYRELPDGGAVVRQNVIRANNDEPRSRMSEGKIEKLNGSSSQDSLC
jgi:hypothetical protein